VNLQTELVIRDSTGQGPGPHSPADPGNVIAPALDGVASYAKE
jgi:LacI family transcriptional regulator